MRGPGGAPQRVSSASRWWPFTPCPFPKDSQVLIELHKSGFARPGDLEFEDFSQVMNRVPSDSSLGTPDGRPELRAASSRSRAKRWPFGKKNKVGSGALGVRSGWKAGGQSAEVPTESTPATWNAESWSRNFPLGCGPRLREGNRGSRPESPLWRAWESL